MLRPGKFGTSALQVYYEIEGNVEMTSAFSSPTIKKDPSPGTSMSALDELDDWDTVESFDETKVTAQSFDAATGGQHVRGLTVFKKVVFSKDSSKICVVEPHGVARVILIERCNQTKCAAHEMGSLFFTRDTARTGKYDFHAIMKESNGGKATLEKNSIPYPPIVACDFCDNDEIIATLTALGDLAFYNIKTHVIKEVKVTAGPVTPSIAGLPSSPFVVVCNSIGGYQHVIDAHKGIVLPLELQLNPCLASLALSAPSCVTRKDGSKNWSLYVAHSQLCISILKFVEAPLHQITDVESKSFPIITHEDCSVERHRILERFVEEQRQQDMIKCEQHDEQTDLLLIIWEGAAAIGRIGKTNLQLVLHIMNPTTQSFRNGFWVPGGSGFVLVRSDGIAMIYQLQESSRSVADLNYEFNGEVTFEVESAFFPYANGELLGIGAGRNPQTTVLQFFSLSPEEMGTQLCEVEVLRAAFVVCDPRTRTLQDVSLSPGSASGHPLASLVLSDGSVYACIFGSEQSPVQLAPSGVHGTKISCSLVHFREGCGTTDPHAAFIALGTQEGQVMIFYNEKLMLSLHCHADTVVNIVVPVHSVRVNVSLVSIAREGSVVLYREHQAGYYEVLSVFQSPCHRLLGVYWDNVKEYCFVNSISGCNVWHLVTGKLERQITNNAFVSFCVKNTVNLLESHSATTDSQKLCSIRRVQYVDRCFFAVVVRLEKVLAMLQESAYVSQHASAPSSPRSPVLKKSSATLPPNVVGALSFLLSSFDGEGVDTIRSALGLAARPRPAIRKSIAMMNPTQISPERMTYNLIILISIVKVITLTRPNIDTSLVSVIVAEFTPSIEAAVQFLVHANYFVQFAARRIISGAVSSSSAPVAKRVFSLLLERTHRSDSSSSVDHYRETTDWERIAAILACAIIVHQSCEHNTPWKPTSDEVNSVAHLLVTLALETKPVEMGSSQIIVDFLAEFWSFFSLHLPSESANRVLDHLFFAFCPEIKKLRGYQVNPVPRAMISIGLQNLPAFFTFLESLFHGKIGNVPGDPAAVRTGTLLLVTAVLVHSPHKVIKHFAKVLGFIWSAIDPLAPNKQLRDACMDSAQLVIKKSVQLLPMVSLQQHRLAVGMSNGQVAVYDIKSTSKTAVFNSHPLGVACIAANNAGPELATLSCAMDCINVFRLEGSGFFAVFSGNTTTFRLAKTIPIKLSDANKAQLNKNGGVLSMESVTQHCRLTWVSPSCLLLHSPFHNDVQISTT